MVYKIFQTFCGDFSTNSKSNPDYFSYMLQSIHKFTICLATCFYIGRHICLLLKTSVGDSYLLIRVTWLYLIAVLNFLQYIIRFVQYSRRLIIGKLFRIMDGLDCGLVVPISVRPQIASMDLPGLIQPQQKVVIGVSYLSITVSDSVHNLCSKTRNSSGCRQ